MKICFIIKLKFVIDRSLKEARNTFLAYYSGGPRAMCHVKVSIFCSIFCFIFCCKVVDTSPPLPQCIKTQTSRVRVDILNMYVFTGTTRFAGANCMATQKENSF